MAAMKDWKVRYTSLNPYSGYSREHTMTVQAATESSAIRKANAKLREYNRKNPCADGVAMRAELA